MRLVMTLLVRDEIDIIRSNLDFHIAQGVDFIIATDNLSVDGTDAVLREYERQGLLHYIHEASDTYDQYKWVTRMAQLAAGQYGADWVINNDADEFWMPTQGTLKDAFVRAKSSDAALLAPRVNYLPPSTERQREPFYESMVVRERESHNSVGQPLPGKSCHRGIAGIEVDQGNHFVRRRGAVLPMGDLDATILHFPMRSYAQFCNKIAKGGAAYSRNMQLPPGVGATWRKLYKDWQEGRLEAHYQAMVRSPRELEAALSTGSLLIDTRVRDVLRRFAPG
jgi:hypothetical protein